MQLGKPLEPLRHVSRNLRSGVAFLETVVVAGMVAGILVALVYGVHSVAQTAITSNADVRGGYMDAATLLTATDIDFATASNVFVLYGERAQRDWTNAASFTFPAAAITTAMGAVGSAGTSTVWEPPHDDWWYPAWYTGLLSAAPATQPVATADWWEVHFLSGTSLIAVLLIDYDPVNTTIRYRRFTQRGLTHSFTYSDVNLSAFLATSGNTSLVIPNRAAVSQPVARAITVKIPNPRHNYASPIDSDVYERLEITRTSL